MTNRAQAAASAELGKQPNIQNAVVMNSYYDSTGTAYVDVMKMDSVGSSQPQMTHVPVLKLGGLSTSLPPVGATAVIGFFDGNDNRPFLIGYLDTQITKSFVTDNKMPKKPSTNLTR